MPRRGPNDTPRRRSCADDDDEDDGGSDSLLLLAADAGAATALNHDGHSPLELAVEQGHAECADLLRAPHEISETVLGMEAEDTSEVVVPRVEATAEEEEGAADPQADRDENSAAAEQQAEEGEPEEASGPVHREASVDLPPRPPAIPVQGARRGFDLRARPPALQVQGVRRGVELRARP